MCKFINILFFTLVIPKFISTFALVKAQCFGRHIFKKRFGFYPYLKKRPL